MSTRRINIHSGWRKATAASSAGSTSRNSCRAVPTAAQPKSAFTLMKSSGAGASRRLLEEAIARAPSLGINAMVGLIFAHNEPSLRLFHRLGFERWGLLPRVARLDGIERDLAVVGRHI